MPTYFFAEMEKACDRRYGTQFAATPHLAAQDYEALCEKAYQHQSDLRNMERLGYVVPARQRERAASRPMPGPLPVPISPAAVVSEKRHSLPMKIRLQNGKAKKDRPRKYKKREKRLKDAAAVDAEKGAVESPLAQSVSQPS